MPVAPMTRARRSSPTCPPRAAAESRWRLRTPPRIDGARRRYRNARSPLDADDGSGCVPTGNSTTSGRTAPMNAFGRGRLACRGGGATSTFRARSRSALSPATSRRSALVSTYPPATGGRSARFAARARLVIYPISGVPLGTLDWSIALSVKLCFLASRRLD